MTTEFLNLNNASRIVVQAGRDEITIILTFSSPDGGERKLFIEGTPDSMGKLGDALGVISEGRFLYVILKDDIF